MKKKHEKQQRQILKCDFYSVYNVVQQQMIYQL